MHQLRPCCNGRHLIRHHVHAEGSTALGHGQGGRLRRGQDRRVHGHGQQHTVNGQRRDKWARGRDTLALIFPNSASQRKSSDGPPGEDSHATVAQEAPEPD